MELSVYGIGNPLIDIVVQVTEVELASLGLHKGTMHLIGEERRSELLAFIDGKKITYECGGSAPNTLVTLALFGEKVMLAGKVGRDEYGELYARRLADLSIEGELACCEAPTGTSIILVTPDSERTMNTYLGANRRFSPEDVAEDAVRESDYLYFAGYMWDTENQKNGVMKAIAAAEEAGVQVVFDLADPFAVSRNREAFLRLVREHADIVFANGEEARILFDNYDPGECAKSLGGLCSISVVKDGARGSYVFNEDRLSHIPVRPVRALDSTGAGDTYSAGFILGLLRGLSHPEAARLASHLAGKVIRKHGAQLSASDVAAVRLSDYDGA